jgi:hypothetical protein
MKSTGWMFMFKDLVRNWDGLTGRSVNLSRQ